jgi:hypothetical protein
MRLRCAVLFLLLCTLASLAVGQEITGNISGIVSDTSGAAVPNATVTVKNTNTNLVRTYKTDNEGRYVATLLPIGKYSVAVEGKGFQKYVQSNIELNVNERLTVNPQLKVGTADQVVEVQAEATQVDTQSAAATGLVSGTQVRELSLNNRNYEQLLTLVPGVTSTASDQIFVGTTNPLGTNTVNFSVNGARTSQNNWMVDGADNVDRGSNATLLSYPSVDAIAEFKLVRGAYDPEFGRNGGGQINVVTRSGTSTFHGSAYEFLRNDKLNANTYLNNHKAVPTPRNPLRYNNFGWTLGGPVYIPHVYNNEKNKTFFFFSQEYRRVITYTSQLATVATTAERGGTFAHPVCTAWNGTTCTATGTTIPAAAFSATAGNYIKDIYSKIPAPDAVTHQFLSRYSAVNNFREELLKLDHNFGSKLSLSGKLLWDAIPSTEPGGLFTASPIAGVSGTATDSPGHNFTVRGTYTLSPTLLLEAGYGYSYGAIISNITGTIAQSASPDIKPTLPFAPTILRVPTVTLTGLSSLTGFGPYQDYNRNHSVFGNVSKIMGRHSIKAGAIYYHYQKTENAGGNNVGTFAFDTAGNPCPTAATAGCNGVATASFEQSWANFLTGHVSSFTQDQFDITPDIRDNQFEFFGQDQIRVKSNLTLTLGMRWSFFRQPTDATGRLSNFDPAAFNPAKAPCFTAAGLINIGAACNANWDPLNGIIIGGQNSPYGNKVGKEDNRAIAPRVGIAWDPFGAGKTSIRAGFGMFYDTTLFGVVEQNMFQNPPFVNSPNIPNTSFDNPAGGTAAVNASPKRIYSRVPVDLKTPYTEQWSLDIQQEVMPSLLLDVGYYGSVGRHLIGIADINQPRAGAYKTQVAQCSATVTTNCVAPNAFITTSNISLINPIRPFPGYVGIDGIRPWFDSNYNSLQASLQKRFSHDSQFSLAYTWSHALTNNQTDRSTPPQDLYNFDGDYGPMQQDRRHVITANYVYSLPWYTAQKGVVGHLLGGWEFSGIITAQSGVPLTVGTASGTNDFAGQGCRGPSTCAVRPDQVGDPNAGAPHTFDTWFNTSAFVNPAAGQYRPGSARRGTILGPGLWRVDFSVFKNIKIGERVNTQFRAETFNVFNHTNFDTVNTTTTSPTFGAITNTRDPRQIQLALKLNF